MDKIMDEYHKCNWAKEDIKCIFYDPVYVKFRNRSK